jgi:hypothetical protein
MCNFCSDFKRKHPLYVFCPMCGSNINGGFKPSFVTHIKSQCKETEYGNYIKEGLDTITLKSIK